MLYLKYVVRDNNYAVKLMPEQPQRLIRYEVMINNVTEISFRIVQNRLEIYLCATLTEQIINGTFVTKNARHMQARKQKPLFTRQSIKGIRSNT